jgi:hypothetical protein
VISIMSDINKFDVANSQFVGLKAFALSFWFGFLVFMLADLLLLCCQI